MTTPTFSLLRDDYPVTCYSGATRMQSELSAAFALVAPKPNWKIAIDATIPLEEPSLISDAVVHFTGATPTIDIRTDSLRVRAPGYYATVGA